MFVLEQSSHLLLFLFLMHDALVENIEKQTALIGQAFLTGWSDDLETRLLALGKSETLLLSKKTA